MRGAIIFRLNYNQRYIFLKSPRFSSPTFFRSRSNRPGFLPQFFFAHAKKIEFLAQTPLIITFYCIFKLQFFENCPKKLNFCPKIGKIRYVPVCFPIFVQMYRFCSPPPSSFLVRIITCRSWRKGFETAQELGNKIAVVFLHFPWTWFPSLDVL